MEIRVNIPEELAAQAQTLGLSPEAYVEELLAQQLRFQSLERQEGRSEEEIRSLLDSLAQFSDKIPPMPDTISRDWIYQDHD